MDDKITASRCKENSIETLVLAPGLPTCQTLSILDIVEKSHQGHLSLSISSGEWSLGNANKGFSLDQALRKETLVTVTAGQPTSLATYESHCQNYRWKMHHKIWLLQPQGPQWLISSHHLQNPTHRAMPGQLAAQRFFSSPALIKPSTFW